MTAPHPNDAPPEPPVIDPPVPSSLRGTGRSVATRARSAPYRRAVVWSCLALGLALVAPGASILGGAVSVWDHPFHPARAYLTPASPGTPAPAPGASLRAFEDGGGGSGNGTNGTGGGDDGGGGGGGNGTGTNGTGSNGTGGSGSGNQSGNSSGSTGNNTQNSTGGTGNETQNSTGSGASGSDGGNQTGGNGSSEDSGSGGTNDSGASLGGGNGPASASGTTHSSAASPWDLSGPYVPVLAGASVGAVLLIAGTLRRLAQRSAADPAHRSEG